MVAMWLSSPLAIRQPITMARHRWNLCICAIVHCSVFTNCNTEMFHLSGKLLCIMVRIMVSDKVKVSVRVGLGYRYGEV